MWKHADVRSEILKIPSNSNHGADDGFFLQRTTSLLTAAETKLVDTVKKSTNSTALLELQTKLSIKREAFIAV